MSNYRGLTPQQQMEQTKLFQAQLRRKRRLEILEERRRLLDSGSIEYHENNQNNQNNNNNQNQSMDEEMFVRGGSKRSIRREEIKAAIERVKEGNNYEAIMQSLEILKRTEPQPITEHLVALMRNEHSMIVQSAMSVMNNYISFNDKYIDAFFANNGIELLCEMLQHPKTLEVLFYTIHLIANIIFDGGKVRDETLKLCHHIILQIEEKAIEERRYQFIEIISLYYGFLIQSEPPLPFDFVKQIASRMVRFLQIQREGVIYNTYLAFAYYIEIYACEENQNSLFESVQIFEKIWYHYNQLKPNQFDDLNNITISFMKFIQASTFVPHGKLFYDFIVNNNIVEWLISYSYQSNDDKVKMYSIIVLSNLLLTPDEVEYDMCSIVNRSNLMGDVMKICSFNRMNQITEKLQIFFISFFLLCNDNEFSKYVENGDFYRSIRHLLLLSNIPDKTRIQTIIVLSKMLLIAHSRGMSITYLLENYNLYTIIEQISNSKSANKKLRTKCNNILNLCNAEADYDDLDMM